MPMFKVNVKWGKAKFSDLDLSTDEPPEVFKLQLFSLTNVHPDRQKIMLKGITLKDEWQNLKIKNGTNLLLMGSAEELPSAPVEKTVFLEDMTEDQLASAMDLVTGLENLGNTCYMNATVQLLKSVPEMDVALQNFSSQLDSGQMNLRSDGGSDIDDSVAKGFCDLVKQLKSNEQISIKPFMFLHLIFIRFPHFAQKDDHGNPMQQDANEFLTEMLRICQTKLKSISLNPGSQSSRDNFIDQHFGLKYDIEYKCIDEEGTEEPVTQTTESSLQLNCFISQDVKYMLTGIKSKLKEEITKRSPTLDRDAKYSKTDSSIWKMQTTEKTKQSAFLKGQNHLDFQSLISRLPAYLCVQMVRFYYKEKGQVNAKILKDVKFPMQFDAYELCSPELQRKLKPARDVFDADDEARAEAQLAEKQEGGAKKNNKLSEPKKQPPKEWERYDFPDDIGSNNSGHFELNGVITHQGRSSSSGHYVAWIRKTGDDWLKCDDDNVTPVTSEEVLKLSGGGDWHIAYVLLYGPRRLEKRDRSKQDVPVVAALDNPAPMETNGGS